MAEQTSEQKTPPQLYADMDEARALEIVKGINERAFATMGMHEGPMVPLRDVSLPEMIQATAIVDAINDLAEVRQRTEGGSRTIHVVPAPRLIAAVFCIEHYPEDGADEDPILCVPARNFFGERGVTCLVREGIYGAEYEKLVGGGDDDED